MPAPPCENYGDVTGDGDVNMGDATLVNNHVLNPSAYPLTEEQKKRADVNGDGVINMIDVMLISDYASGAITTFPVCGTPVMPTPNVTSFNIPSGSTLQVDGVEVI